MIPGIDVVIDNRSTHLGKRDFDLSPSIQKRPCTAGGRNRDRHATGLTNFAIDIERRIGSSAVFHGSGSEVQGDPRHDRAVRDIGADRWRILELAEAVVLELEFLV